MSDYRVVTIVELGDNCVSSSYRPMKTAYNQDIRKLQFFEHFYMTK